MTDTQLANHFTVNMKEADLQPWLEPYINERGYHTEPTYFDAACEALKSTHPGALVKLVYVHQGKVEIQAKTRRDARGHHV